MEQMGKRNGPCNHDSMYSLMICKLFTYMVQKNACLQGRVLGCCHCASLWVGGSSTLGAVDGDLLEVGEPRGRQPVALHRLVVLPVLRVVVHFVVPVGEDGLVVVPELVVDGAVRLLVLVHKVRLRLGGHPSLGSE